MWYFLDYNPDPSIFKVTEQTKQLHGTALEVRDEFSDVFYNEPLSDEARLIDYISLKSSSIFTDILWDYLFQDNIKIVSGKVIEIIKDYKILNVKIYKTLIKKGTVAKDYYALRGFGEILEFIDFKKSVFGHYNHKMSKTTTITFNNFRDYRSKSKAAGPLDSINPIEIHFLEHFTATQWDMFPLGYLKPCSLIISASLKRRMENEGLVGFEFKECGFIVI